MVTKVTGKNQVTIPAQLARDLDIQPGTELEWHKGAKANTIEVKIRPSPEQRLQAIQEEAAQYQVSAEEFVADLEHMRAQDDVEDDSTEGEKGAP